MKINKSFNQLQNGALNSVEIGKQRNEFVFKWWWKKQQ